MFKAIGNLFSKHTDVHRRLSDPVDDKTINGSHEGAPIKKTVCEEREGAQGTVTDATKKNAKAQNVTNSLREKGFF